MASKLLASLKRARRNITREISGVFSRGAGKSSKVIEHRFSKVSILMPKDHRLGEYKKRHRLYDQFLPHLAKYLPSGAVVVDVGANVGDTLAAMYSANPVLNFICVEPDDEFFSLLESNAERIRTLDEKVSIDLIKALVGASKEAVLLQGSGGTKNAVISAESPTSMTRRALDDLSGPIREKEVFLIKSDVDGYDYDVIESGLELIKNSQPILFFECQFDHEFQKDSYERLLENLFSRGYESFTVFDNFGEIIIRTKQTSDVIQLFNYLWRQNSKRTSRTLYYYDILISKPKHSELVAACVTDYLELYMPPQEKGKMQYQ